MTGIYKVTNIINGKVYIGQSLDVEHRLKSHRSCSTNAHLRSSIAKYGVDNFLFECIEECDAEDLNSRERFYIQMYNSTDPKVGYNLTSGGERDPGWTHTPQSKKLMSELAKAHANSPEYSNPASGSRLIHKGDITSRAKGQKLEDMLNSGWELGPSEKFIRDGSSKRTGCNNGVYGKGDMFSGENNHFFGKHHTPETIEKIRENMPDTSLNWRGKHHSEVSKEKMRGPRPSVSGQNNSNYGKRGQSSTMYGRKAVHKGDVERRIKSEDVEQYLADGWELGVCPSTLKKLSDNGKVHMHKLLSSNFDTSKFAGTQNKRLINKQGICKYVHIDDISTYLSQGWELGRGKK